MDLVRSALTRRARGSSSSALVLLAGFMSGCGPSTDQLAATALVSSPIAYALALLAVWGLHGLWRERIGKVRPRWGFGLVFGLALAAVALITTRGQRIEADVLAIAAFLCAATSVAGSMLVGRLGLRQARPGQDYGRSVVLAPALVTSLVYAPFMLAWLESGAIEELSFSVAVAIVGVGGTYIAGPLILGLVVETVFARGRAAPEPRC